MREGDRDGVRLVQHLLRHLNDVAALRENAIAARIFDEHAMGDEPFAQRSALAHIRTKVLTAAKMLLTEQAESKRAHAAARRQYEIVVRCDLGSELHRVVAAELGLSHRQFYRERLRACGKLSEFLMQVPQEPAPARTLASEFELRLGCAVGLRNYGQVDAALALLDTLCSEVQSPVDRVRAFCERAAALCDAGRVQQGREGLVRARKAFLAVQLEDAPRAVCAAEIDRVAAMLEWAGGRLREAIEINERAVASLRGGPGITLERGVELAALLTIALATQYREMGGAASLGLLQEARDLISYLHDPSPELRASLTGNIATTYALTAGGIPVALTQLNEQLQFARRHNLQREAVDALSTLCLIYVQRRAFEAALAYGRSALALARTISSAEDFAYCALNVSRIEAVLGHAQQALSLIAEVRSRVEGDATLSIFADMSEAEALLSKRAYKRVADLAARCALRFGGLGMERYLGSALRIEAEALAALGNQRDAAAAIGSAVEVLERRGHMFSLAQAYEVSARLTGNTRHRAAAGELFAIICA
ncbi:MAG TPA: hypothetical protein VJP85_09170 [Candidatus Baltobacteraceae bacterium]|nr:hypothetical protein [Candidatus Baltobacteraceae bacterium]